MMKHLLTALLASCLLVAAAELTDAEWAALKKAALERPRNVIYDNDGDDFNINDGTPTVEGMMAKRTTYLEKYPVNTIVFCVNGSCFQMKMPTANGELEVCEWGEMDNGRGGKYRPVNGVQWCLDNGIDVFQLQIDYARQHGMEIFAQFRFNDTHDYIDTPEKPCPFFSKIKRAHPEWLVGSYENKPSYARWSSYDFTHKEVRDKYAALMTEFVDKYDIDGLFIDFNRWPTIFKSVAWGGVASDEEVELFSEMFRKIRAGTEAAGRRRGRPVLLAVRCPDSVGFCRDMGFDWVGLMAEGAIDIVCPGGDKHRQPWFESIALCHKYGVKCYPSIDMATFWRDPIAATRKETPSYLARVAAAYQQGADGIYYYNLFYESCVKNYMPPNAEAIRLKDKRYYITPTALGSYNGQLRNGEKYNFFPELCHNTNSTLLPGSALDFKMEFGDDLAALVAEGVTPRLKATLVADGEPGVAQFSSNGVAWKHVSSDGKFHFYEAPISALKPGINDFVFTSTASASDFQEKEILKGDANRIDLSFETKTEGGGDELGRHVKLLQPKESVILKDFWVDVMLAPEPKLIAVNGWPAASTSALMLSTGQHRWEDNHVCGEWDAVPGKGAVRAVLSSGGLFADVTLREGRLVAGGKSFPVPPAEGTRRLRVQLHGARAQVFVDGVFCAEIPARNISNTMRDDKSIAALNEKSGGIIRSSGLVTVPSGGAQVKAVRVRLEKEGDFARPLE